MKTFTVFYVPGRDEEFFKAIMRVAEQMGLKEIQTTPAVELVFGDNFPVTVLPWWKQPNLPKEIKAVKNPLRLFDGTGTKVRELSVTWPMTVFEIRGESVRVTRNDLWAWCEDCEPLDKS